MAEQCLAVLEAAQREGWTQGAVVGAFFGFIGGGLLGLSRGLRASKESAGPS
jgi:hypothetical protein